MLKKRVLSLLVLCFLSLVFFKPNLALAQTSVQFQNVSDVGVSLDDKLVLKDGSLVKDVFNSTDDMVNLLVGVIFVGTGLVLFVMTVGAGFAMISSKGGDKEKAKTTLTSALTGFVVMFAAYWIVQIIQLLTGVDMFF